MVRLEAGPVLHLVPMLVLHPACSCLHVRIQMHYWTCKLTKKSNVLPGHADTMQVDSLL